MQPNIGTREQWLAQRRALLRDEKALMRFKDYLVEKRQALPWVLVDKPYVFTGPSGQQALVDLFDGCSQLVIYHFMFGPDWDAGCSGCTQVGNTLNQTAGALRAQDTNLVMVSRADLAKLEVYQQRMGWSLPWVSSGGGDFNVDFHASQVPASDRAPSWSYQEVEFERDENHGISVFGLHSGAVYHTYSSYHRSVELFMANLQLLDLCPSGRSG